MGVDNITAVSAAISWSQPNQPNGIVVSYYLVIRVGCCTIEKNQTFTPGQRIYIATGLNEHTLYTAEVQASTSKGIGILRTELFTTLQSSIVTVFDYFCFIVN